MRRLNSITLSNVRRFGADTTIQLSRGATILLAPNGTGKTAVFEAIEFGLTGKVSRLGESLLPIIREAQTAARVDLDFGDVQASAQVNRSGTVERTGDLSALFSGTNFDDIPYLLRLTHLLDQREGEWLVRADSKVAGSQLARLPISKEGTQVSAALGGIRRSIAEQLKQAKTALEELEAAFNEWRSLTHDRDIAASQSQGALRSREAIAASISEIARQSQSLEQLPAGMLVPPLGQDGLETVHESLVLVVQTKLDRLRVQLTALAEVAGLISRFTSEQSRSEQLGEELATVAHELAQKKLDRAAAAVKLEGLQQALVAAEGERDRIVQQLNRLMSEAQAKEELEHRKQALESADKAVVSADALVQASRLLHEGQEQLVLQHDLIDRQRKALLQVDADLLSAHELLERWEAALQDMADVAASVSRESEVAGALQERVQAEVSLRLAAQAEEMAAKSQHEALNSAADSIRQAVASIATHLPSDRGDCPLCGEEHGAADLQARIAKTLQAIDPKVVDAEQRVKSSTDALRQSTDSLANAEADLRACKTRVTELESRRASLEKSIADLRASALLVGDTPTLASESIRRREEANASAKLQLDEKQRNLGARPESEVFDQAQRSYERAVQSRDSARQGRVEASGRLEQAAAALAAITADAPPSRTLEELSVAQNQNTSQVAELGAKVNAEQSAMERQQIQLTDATNRASGLEGQVSEVQARIASIRASWRQLSFLGDPAAEIASSREAQLQSAANDLGGHSEELQSIKIEIGAWRKLEQTRVAQELLDRRRGELSEDEFAAGLHQRMERERSRRNHFTLLSDAMETLGRHLTSEISNVHKHVLAVVPRWQALLKRVVREPRFSGTSLDFRSLYRKEHAEVSVPLHGEAVPVPAIASEAQLTDLQLTFLLSMAVDHQWCSWRGLLLDDPTQHHDLVHAASVFDVLRDYIVEHGFQVVIATHDALQARYFMRKLQNDGIDARIWSLAPSSSGVTASEGPWPARTQVTVNAQNP